MTRTAPSREQLFDSIVYLAGFRIDEGFRQIRIRNDETIMIGP